MRSFEWRIGAVSCYFTDHSESLDLTTIFSSSTFDNGQRKATVLVCSEYLGLAPDPCRVPPLVSFFFSFAFCSPLSVLHFGR